jgi:anti-sigma regulatory factor (Ser/Thr protein kinase)
VEWQVTLPCRPSMVPVARRLVRGLMPDCPRLDDAEQVLGELAGNMVRYGSGEMAISVTSSDGRARLVVTDSGRADEEPEWVRELAEVGDEGLDLLIVNVLAERWGFDRQLDGHETLWAELAW